MVDNALVLPEHRLHVAAVQDQIRVDVVDDEKVQRMGRRRRRWQSGAGEVTHGPSMSVRA